MAEPVHRPALNSVAIEETLRSLLSQSLHFLHSRSDSGLVWREPNDSLNFLAQACSHFDCVSCPMSMRSAYSCCFTGESLANRRPNPASVLGLQTPRDEFARRHSLFGRGKLGSINRSIDGSSFRPTDSIRPPQILRARLRPRIVAET